MMNDEFCLKFIIHHLSFIILKLPQIMLEIENFGLNPFGGHQFIRSSQVIFEAAVVQIIFLVNRRGEKTHLKNVFPSHVGRQIVAMNVCFLSGQKGASGGVVHPKKRFFVLEIPLGIG